MADSPTQLVRKKRRSFRWTKLRDKQAICADYAMGMTQIQIGEKYGLARATVARILQKFKQEAPEAEMSKGISAYRNSLRDKSFVAIESGLDCSTDPYKRAHVGIAVAKGLGELQGDQPTNPLAVIFAHIPPSERHLFTGSTINAQLESDNAAALGDSDGTAAKPGHDQECEE